MVLRRWTTIVMASLLVAGCSGRSAAALVRLDDIATIEVHTASMPNSEQTLPKPLQASNPDDRPAMTVIVGWLNAAQQVGAEQAESGPPPTSLVDWVVRSLHRYPPYGGRGETDLVIRLKNGQSVLIRPAITCTWKQLPNGTEHDCMWIQGQVAWETKPGRPGIRLMAPDLAKWLSGGWPSGFPTSQSAYSPS